MNTKGIRWTHPDPERIGGRFVGHIADYRWNLVQSGQLSSAPAPFAGNNFVLIRTYLPHHNRLHHALGFDGFRQFFQLFRVHVATRLIFTTLTKFHGKMRQFAISG